MDLTNLFARFARGTSRATGHPAMFMGALALLVVWGVTGPVFGFSDTWQLVINTLTTIVTFLMVFLIQHTQNRDTEAIQIKLDELIRAVHGARNSLIDLEEETDQDLAEIKAHYSHLAARARAKSNSSSEERHAVHQEGDPRRPGSGDRGPGQKDR